MATPSDHAARMARARRSLIGLSVGDAFGERFFVSPMQIATWLTERRVDAPTPWRWTLAGIAEAESLIASGDVQRAVARLGNGSGVSSQDTVPFCLWCVARHPRDFRAAMWTTVSGLGDRDTTCAIVGGIVAAGEAEVPAEWIAAREPLG